MLFRSYNSRPAYIVELAKKRLLASARLIGALVERNLAEQALQESGKRYRALFEQVGDGILLLDVRGEILSVNEAFASMHGYTEEEALHLELKELDVEGKARFPERMRQIMGGETITFDVEHYHKDGHTFPLSVTANLILSGNERLIIVVHRDLTERRRAEEALRESEERYRELVENANSIIIRMDNLGNIVFFNEFAQRFFGYNEEEILGRNVVGTIVPETDHSGRDLRAMILDIGVHPERYPSNENENMLRDGTRVWVSWTNKPLFDSAGRVREILCVGNDATARKRVEEEKAKLEAQLQQAQKMESVGRLAGGVAHDFNNMLQVILVNADLAMDRIPPGSPLSENLDEIRNSAQRSADLTRQLLAFARRQTVAPKVLDLNETVAGMLKMLQRLIGENIDLDWQPGSNLWAINMDPSQIDQILANLCVNARDAIVDVGKLTISTGNSAFDEDYCEKNPGFAPGEYVRLAVSDNGCGMDSETLSHIFEPFFTTKGFGEGTGLGLATVYGAVKQNNGFINVCSETGHGTTFTIYLPRHLGKAEQMRAGGPAKAGASGHETILLVEDDPSVLKLTARLLKGQGYNLLPALTPGDAIRLAREYSGEIHLLVTDVIMPEMNGRDLAGNVQSLYPNIKRLFMSGYTGDIIASQGVLDKGVHFIQKPFSVQRLLAEVRAALGSG